MSQAQKQFEKIVEDAKNDPKIVGLYLGGSRGKGFENEFSDYDIQIVVSDIEAKTRLSKLEFDDFDISVDTLEDFEKYAAWGSDDAWDRYDFSHGKVLIDKTGTIQKIVDEKGSLPEAQKDDLIKSSLCSYINSVFRSVKCHRKQNLRGAQLEASTGIPCLLDVVFGIHNRLVPFFGYLEDELKTRPLEKLSTSAEKFAENISKILSTADLPTQQEMLKMVEKIAREEGYGIVFDDWEGKDKWAMNYRPQ